jgi:DNA polymerase III sliding clamp (beta) subunit (PCNA family)
MEVQRENLLNALLAVKGGLASKEIMEQSTSFIFQGGKVSTFNDEVAIRHPVDLDITAAVPSEKLLDYLTRCKAETVEVEVEGNEMKIHSGRSRAGFSICPEIKLDMSEIGNPIKWKAIPEDLVEAIQFALFSASTDMTKAILTCVHIKDDFVESCDDFRLTKRTMKSSMVDGDELLIPATSAQKLIKFDVKKYSVTKGWAHFKSSNGATLSCHAFNQEYPDTSELLEMEGEKITLPKRMSEMVERARIFSNAAFAQDEKVTISIGDGALEIEGRSEQGWCTERAKMEYDGKPKRFQVHPDFLAQMLSLLNEIVIGDPSDENAKIKLEGENFVHVVSMMAEEEKPAPKAKRNKKVQEVEE